MAAMFSSPSNDSHPEPQFSCFMFPEPSAFAFTAYNVTLLLLLLPLCAFVLHDGLQQWMERGSSSSSSSSSATSHSDCFTYNMAAMELVNAVGSVLNCVGAGSANANLLGVARYFLFFAWDGEVYFNILTCVERYLAVVHPITYRRLRSGRSVRIRNIGIGLLWLVATVKSMFMSSSFLILELCLITLSLTGVSVCSVLVLRVLIRPGPGERGGARERGADRSKRRAFDTIATILAVLSVKFAADLTVAVTLLDGFDCLTIVCCFWLSLPGSLVLPLLFLLRRAARRTSRRGAPVSRR